MKHKIIIFDVDGVLLDTMSIWANSANLYLLEILGINAPPELDQKCAAMSLLEAGEYIKELYPEITLSPKELAEGVAEFIRERYWKAPGKPGLKKTLRTLCQKDFTLFLATASEKKNVRGALMNLGVWECFSDIFTCTEIGYSKNYTEYYEEVAKRIGVPCQELIMVEDSLHSMITAKKAGLTVAGIYERFSAEKTAEIKEICDVYVQNLEELEKWLQNEL